MKELDGNSRRISFPEDWHSVLESWSDNLHGDGLSLRGRYCTLPTGVAGEMVDRPKLDLASY